MSLQKPIIKVGVVAGEYSGDRLGAKIISGLKKTHHVELYGVGGPKICLLYTSPSPRDA